MTVQRDNGVGAERERMDARAKLYTGIAFMCFVALAWCFPISYPIGWFFIWRSKVWHSRLKALLVTEGWSE